MVFDNYRIGGPYTLRHRDVDYGRKYMTLYDIEDKKYVTMFYSRYLMCLKENRILRKDEEVDHIDDNNLNDSIENLQIITRWLNVQKSNGGKIYTMYVCPMCGSIFERGMREMTRRTNFIQRSSKPLDSVVCGVECSIKRSYLYQTFGINYDYSYEEDGYVYESSNELGSFTDNTELFKLMDKHGVKHK